MRIWHHVWPSGTPSGHEALQQELDVEVRVGEHATVRLPALQRLRLLSRGFGEWRQGTSVHDTVYDTSRDDPDIEGSGTLIGMFKNSNDAWNAVECHNIVPLLVHALLALLDANAEPAKDPPPGVPVVFDGRRPDQPTPPPRCNVCCKEITLEELTRVHRALTASAFDNVWDCCEHCFVVFLGNTAAGPE